LHVVHNTIHNTIQNTKVVRNRV